jgi:sirohydrochlorin cobaltochelatase
MQHRESVILFAHGARDARWSVSVDTLATAIRAHAPHASVRTAFLELQWPKLPEALEAAVSEGAERIHVVPVFWAGAGHIENDLPPLLAAFAARHPEVSVRTLPVLSELPGMLDFIASAVAQALTPAPAPQPSPPTPLPRSGRGEPDGSFSRSAGEGQDEGSVTGE